LRVLFIRTDPEIVQLCLQELAQVGFDTGHAVAGGVDELNALLDAARYDLVLTEFSAPAWNWRAALQALRQRTQPVPLIVLVRKADAQVLMNCVLEGAADCLHIVELFRLPVSAKQVLELRAARHEPCARDVVQADLRFRQLFEASADAILQVDSGGRIVLANAPAGELFHCRPEELWGVAVEELVPEQFRAGHAEHRRHYQVRPVTRPMGSGLDLWALRRDRTTFPADITLSPLETKDGTQTMCVIRDVTERHLAEAAIRRQAQLIEMSHDAVIVREPAGVILQWNAGAEEMYGWTASEALGKVTHELFHTGFPVSLAEVEAALERLGHWDGELQHSRRDGQRITVESRHRLMRATDTTPAAVLETNRDITPRKRAEEALHRQAQLIDLAHDAIIVRALDGRILQWNAGAKEIYGWSGTEAVGKVTHDLLQTTFPGSRQEVMAAIERNGRWDGELTHRRKDGSVVIVESRHVVVGSSGGYSAVLEINRNITSRKRAEQEVTALNAQLQASADQLAAANKELQLQNREVERANRLKSEFLASMSHELRTPLNAIIGFSDLLAEQTAGALAAKQQRFLSHIQQGARHLLALINDILDLSRVEAGRLELHRENISVAGVLAEVLVGIRPTAMAKHIDVQSSIGPDMGAFADHLRFKQILYNLISNAVKFTPDGGRIWIEAIERRGRLTVSVDDTGIGIPAEELESVFDAFHQVGASTKGVREGTGLGLAITKRLVEEHGGRIWVESEVGNGTRLSFTVHAARDWEETGPAEDRLPEILAVRARPLILIVDDEAPSRELLASWLAPEGYELVMAGSSDEALAKAAELSPDAITLNMLMPGRGGRETLYTLKRTPITSRIPVIVVTIVDEPKVGLALGAAEYLVKPVDRNVLLEAIRRHVGPSCDGPARVLVVDDEAGTRELLKETLEEHGYVPLLAGSGEQALDTLEHVPVNAVLLDLIMPQMDGFELLVRLKDNPGWSRIPVLVLTGKELSEAEVETLRKSTIGLFHKSTDWKKQLLADLRRIVGEQMQP
jgi:PAS domain S-box-containing protein